MKYTKGNSTLQGGKISSPGLSRKDVLDIVNSYDIPALELSTKPNENGSGLLLSSPTKFSEPLFYEDENGKQIQYGADYGNPLAFDIVVKDNFQLLSATEKSDGAYLFIDLTNLYGKYYDVPYDQRLGFGKFGISIQFERVRYTIKDNEELTLGAQYVYDTSTVVGSRTVALCGVISNLTDYSLYYVEPIWVGSSIPVPDGVNDFYFETQYFSYNLLQIKRNAVALWEAKHGKPYPFTKDLLYRVQVYCHHTNTTDLTIGKATLWLIKLGEQDDPEKHKG